MSKLQRLGLALQLDRESLQVELLRILRANGVYRSGNWEVKGNNDLVVKVCSIEVGVIHSIHSQECPHLYRNGNSNVPHVASRTNGLSLPNTTKRSHAILACEQNNQERRKYAGILQ